MKTLLTTQIDLIDCNYLISDVSAGNIFLEELVTFIGMRKIPEEMIGCKNPNSFYFDNTKVMLSDVEAGFTGVITLFESHIAFHSFDVDRFVSIVVCSCKPYSSEDVGDFCRSFFMASKVTVNICTPYSMKEKFDGKSN